MFDEAKTIAERITQQIDNEETKKESKDHQKKYLDILVQTIYGEETIVDNYNLSRFLPDEKESFSPMLRWPTDESSQQKEPSNFSESAKISSKKILRFKKREKLS